MMALAGKVAKGEFVPIQGTYSQELVDMINSMLTVNPKQRPSANELINR